MRISLGRLYFGVVALALALFITPVYAFEFEDGPRYDLGGQTVVIVKDRGSGVPETGTEQYERWQAVEKFFNCKIELILTGQYNYQAAIARIMAGEPVDIVRFELNQLMSLITTGLLMPLNEVFNDSRIDALDAPDWVKQVYKIANRMHTYRGKIYATNAEDFRPPVGLTCFWNKSMFEREGLPSLYDVIDSGEWTWDKMLEIARRLTKDTDGDGVVDQFGTGQRLASRNGYNLIAANGGALTREVDGRVVAAIQEDAAVEAVNFVKQLVEEGLTTFSKPNAKADYTEFAEGHIGICFQSGAEYKNGIKWWYMPQQMKDDWGVAPFPRAPRANDTIVALSPQDVVGVGVPLSSRYDPEAMLALFRALYPWNPDAYEMELAEYETLVRSEEDFEAIKKYLFGVDAEDFARTPTALRHWAKLPGFKWADAVTGKIDYKTHVEEILPALQAALDDMFNKEY